MSLDLEEENLDNKELQKAINLERKNGDCIVAYLDILGFKELVNKYLNPQNTFEEHILEIITSAMDDAKRPINEYFSESEFKGVELIKFKQFSDCVCLSMPDFYGSKVEAAMIGMFILILKNYNFNFTRKNLYLRGGAAIGFHYQDENIIFSDGLIKAYYLESKKSVYPRIILDEEIVKRIKRLWKTQKSVILDFGIEKLLLTDWEGTPFINPFTPTQSMGNMMENKFKESKLSEIDNKFQIEIKQNLINKINEHKFNGDNHILTKYLWFKELLMWNMDPESSKIKFEYLLKPK